jgi:hypothetical protein
MISSINAPLFLNQGKDIRISLWFYYNAVFSETYNIDASDHVHRQAQEKWQAVDLVHGNNCRTMNQINRIGVFYFNEQEGSVNFPKNP